MAAGTFSFFDQTAHTLMSGDLDGATIKCALVSSAYTPNQDTHDEWGDVSANEISGTNGYTTGGATLASVALTEIASGYKVASSNVTWTASGGSIAAWRYAVFYVSGAYNGKTSPLLGYFLGDSTPADVPATTDTNTLTLNCPAGGWFTLTR
jgi:hypothetical protein